jgi:hypothetical protein
MTCNCCAQPMVEGMHTTANGLYLVEILVCVNDNCAEPTMVDIAYHKVEDPY